MTRRQSTRGPEFPKVQQLTWDGVPVLHRAGSDHPQLGHIEPQTHLVDAAGSRSLVVTGGLETPILVRVVVSTPRQTSRDRHHVKHDIDVTALTPDVSSHQAIVAHWAAEWDMVPEAVAA